MPVTVRPSEHEAEPWGSCGTSEAGTETVSFFHQASSPEQLLHLTTSDDNDHGGRGERASRRSRTSNRTTGRPAGLIQTSFSDLNRKSNTLATKNGLVHTIIEAYNNHHHLILRPDDVWLAILTQLGIHIATHADELRHLFVTHPTTTEHLHIEAPPAITEARAETGGVRSDSGAKTQGDTTQGSRVEGGTAADALGRLDHGKLAIRMASLLSERLLDPDLGDWFQPAFSTTSAADKVTAAVALMGTMRKYFTYSWGTRCGIPSVTLLGTAEDWALVRDRCTSRLGSGALGGAASRWHRASLVPVLDSLVACFADPDSGPARRFWQGVCCAHRPNGSGTTTYSGWVVSAFCHWAEDGTCLHGDGRRRSDRGGGEVPVCISRGEVPMGFVSVPVLLLDQGLAVEAEMMAGSVALTVSRSAAGSKSIETDKTEGGRWHGYDTIQPDVGWFMYKV